MTTSWDFELGVDGFRFSDLYATDRLSDLLEAFWRDARLRQPDAVQAFQQAATDDQRGPAESERLIAIAKLLDAFLTQLFGIESDVQAVRAESDRIRRIFRFKETFWSHKVLRRLDSAESLDTLAYLALDERVRSLVARRPHATDPTFSESTLADLVLWLLELVERLRADSSELEESLDSLDALATLLDTRPDRRDASAAIEELLAQIAEWGVQTQLVADRRSSIVGWISYLRPAKIDYEQLVECDRSSDVQPDVYQISDEHLRRRDGFELTDQRMDRTGYLREMDYCILCHPREKDSCSHGLHEKAGGFKINPLGVALEGCPLDERISEMHSLRLEGYLIGALAMIMLDNPLCPGTGHRICNDCMKSCIYQKQEPVNIPQAETGVLTDVLALPYGFEIYSLLTRFNPLHRELPIARPYNGVNVLVVGLGPAGYTLSNYLANYGFGVVGIDGLKLEPVADELTGRGHDCPRPIKDYHELTSSLDRRVLMGFGGVSEYGITVRWDKNFLAVIYLTLLRRSNLRFYGGTRFGGTLQIEDAWEQGFQHIALATGAGRPTIIDMKNNLSRGIRKASDFLMALQLTGAFKRSSLANLQVRLPAIVLGGGLTAIDTATELLAYYPVQVEKVLDQFEQLSAESGADTVLKMCDEEEREILDDFLEHGRQVRAERRRAAEAGEPPQLARLCRQWGGVSVCYRRRLRDAPAYRLNHEEVTKALEEGIAFIENMTPLEAHRDRFGAVRAVTFKRGDGELSEIAVRSVMVAAGTSPNIVYEKEYPGSFALDARGHFFQKFRAEPMTDGTWQLVRAATEERDAFFTSYNQHGRFISFYGDNHPSYAGNVVKAMASAKHGAPQVARLFHQELQSAMSNPVSMSSYQALIAKLDETLCPRVVRVERLTPTIVEVIVKAHYAAHKFQPGQFYRLQNYESYAPLVDGKRLALEGLALTGAWVDREHDLLSMIVLEMGVSSRLCATLRPGEPVVVMGPTGAPSEIPKNETVLLAGGGLGNAVLFSISRAMRANGCRVIYFAGYRSSADLFKQSEIEEGTDQVIWAVDQGSPIVARRPQDGTFVGNIVKAMVAYAQGELHSSPLIPLQEVDRIFAIGSDRMMAAVTEARHNVLRPFLKHEHVGIASINSLMQCMMKEVCAQCLQKQIDPVTGAEAPAVFSCFNQDQEMDRVDFRNLRERLKTNSLAEKLSNRQLDLLLAKT